MHKAAPIFISILTSILLTPSATAWNRPLNHAMGNTNTKWLWTGAGADSLWTNGANWCGTFRNGVCEGTTGAPPTSGAALVFDGTCVANANNCTPTSVPSGVLSYAGIHLRSGYAGTLNFGTANVTITGNFVQEAGTFTKTTGLLTIGRNWTMTGGTFNGGSGNVTMNGGNNVSMLLSGGSYTATSGTTALTVQTINLSGLTSFTHSSGLWQANVVGNNTSFHPGGHTYYSARFAGCNRTTTLQANLVLEGNLEMGINGSSGCWYNLNAFEVELKQGNLLRYNDGSPGGSTIVRFTGSGEQQINMQGANRGLGNPLVFAQPVSGSVKFMTYFSSGGMDDSANLGTIVPNGQSIAWWNGTYNVTGVTWPNLTLTGNAGSYVITNGFVTDLTLNGGTTTGSGTGSLTVYGNVTVLGNGLRGRLTIDLAGTSTSNIDSTGTTTPYFPSIKFNKTGAGAVTFTGTPRISGDFNYVQGSYTAPAVMEFGGSAAVTAVVTTNGYNHNDVKFVGVNYYQFADQMNVSGNVSIENTTSGYMNGPGVIAVSGNVSSVAGAQGFYPSSSMTGIKFVGSNQSVDFSASAASFRSPGLYFYGSGTTTVLGTFAVHATTSGTIIDHDSGAVDATGSNITLSSTRAPAFTINAGSIAFGGFTFNNNATNTISASTMTVNGLLSISSFATGRSLHGPIHAYGDVLYSSYGYGGNHSLTFRGNNSTLTISGTPTITSQSVTVAKTAGQKLSLASNYSMTAGTSLNVTSGEVDLAGQSLTISGGGALNLSGTTLRLSSGTLTVNGSSIGAGPYGGGTIAP